MESEQAERILRTIADSLEEGKGFVVDQAPDVVQQLILWGRVESVLGLVIPLVVALPFFVVARRCHKKWNLLEAADKWDKDDWPKDLGIIWIVANLVGWVIVLISISVAASNLQVWLAPKVYALEYLFKIAK